MAEDEGQARHDTPATRQLALNAEIEQVIQVVNLVPVDFALLLFYGADKVAERLLVPIPQRDSPPLRMGVFRNSACGSREHTKPGCACTSRHSALARGRHCEPAKQTTNAHKRSEQRTGHIRNNIHLPPTIVDSMFMLPA
jgi:hypothetical protein